MKEIVLLIYGIFAGHSLLLAALLFLRHKHSGNRLLGLILLLLTARVGKSILSLAIPSWALPVNVVGLVCMAALGPLILFYIKELYTSSKMPLKKAAFHFFLAAVCLGAWNWTLVSIAYFVVTAQLLCYLIYSSSLLSRNAETYSVDNIRWRWSKGVITGLFVVWVSFTLQVLVYTPVVYLANIGLSIVVLYVLSWWALRQNKLFVESSKKSTDTEHDAYIAMVGEKIKKLMDEELFIDPELNLSKLAKHLNVQAYMVSKAINSYFNLSFPELILRYRLRKAEQLLSSFNKFYTIEAIAYESGFNTLSVFYQAFKKINGMTPAQYRKVMEDKTNLAQDVKIDNKASIK